MDSILEVIKILPNILEIRKLTKNSKIYGMRKLKIIIKSKI